MFCTLGRLRYGRPNSLNPRKIDEYNTLLTFPKLVRYRYFYGLKEMEKLYFFVSFAAFFLLEFDFNLPRLSAKAFITFGFGLSVDDPRV